MPSASLNVIALISGGKDSFFSLLHCVHNGHRIVALANLFPSQGESVSPAVQIIDPAEQQPAGATGDGRPDAAPDQDLNSFMYQTVGHEIVPLYAAATGLPLYRQPILGSAVRHERDYDHADAAAEAGEETESMVPLLRAVMARHPEANALCAGAILSTYQRTRVESVALRLGLAPLAYLWKYPVLPPSPSAESAERDDAQLLRDMAAAGLEARVVKVASAGLDEGFLWERATGAEGAERVRRALRRFGVAQGAALGEGGEFETVVLDGPAPFFKKRITIPEAGRRVVSEGGGTSWLMLRGARLEERPVNEGDMANIQTPDLFDLDFLALLRSMLLYPMDQPGVAGIPTTSKFLAKTHTMPTRSTELHHWFVVATSSSTSSIESETLEVVERTGQLLHSASIDPSQVTNTIIILRDMSDFPRVNGEYGKLFAKPNPPSRVTISCGDLLPAGCNIAVHLTAPAPQARADRDGLHVQSQSYWAPANIGPYSQAIDVPITLQHEPTGLRSVSIAGQIPLIPASMSLPAPSEASLERQVVLSLQHLWRIGIETRVQYWTSAVAYFSRSSSVSDMQRRARLAACAWRLIHTPPDEEEDSANDLDPWDLKYNPEYMTLGGGQAETPATLPDWSVLTLQQQNEPDSCIPPFFAAEVESLPRQSSVEWHAHLGLSQVGEASLEVVYAPEMGVAGWRAWHMLARASTAVFIHTVLECDLKASETTDFDVLTRDMDTAYRESRKTLSLTPSDVTSETPYLVYLDRSQGGPPWPQGENSEVMLPFAVIPCRSLWSLSGERVGCVALYRTTVGTKTL